MVLTMGAMMAYKKVPKMVEKLVLRREYKKAAWRVYQKVVWKVLT